MDDLIAFLSARLDAQEAQAQRELEFIQVAVNRDRSDQRRRVDPDRDDGARTVSPWTQRETTRAEWMLADVAAKRAIIAALERADQAAGNLISPEAAYAMEYAVRLLAQPFADHPDFKAEWRVA